VGENFEWPAIPLYLHVLTCHYNDKLKVFGSLKKYSQEGTESHHQLQKSIQSRQTRQGGGRGAKKGVCESILVCEYRKLFLSYDLIGVTELDEGFTSEWF
jgi:hypothetical protein